MLPANWSVRLAIYLATCLGQIASCSLECDLANIREGSLSKPQLQIHSLMQLAVAWHLFFSYLVRMSVALYKK